MKLGRNYKLSVVNPQGEQVDITPPFTIHFNVHRNNLATANTGEIEVTNLGPENRNRIFKDRFDSSLEWKLQLWAGYGTDLYKVMAGNIREAFSYKKGPNWLTKILVFDGADAFQNGFVSATYSGGTARQDYIRKTIETLPGIQTGYLGTYAQGEAPKRGKVLFGPTREVLMTETRGNFFIDNSTLHVSADDEYDNSEVLDLDASQLLQTPKRQDSSLDISILFYPQARVNVAAKLTSLYPIYNGTYKICAIHHDVIISESENGKAETNLGLLLLGRSFKALA